MVATVLLSMIILVILQVLIASYRVAAKARLGDHARYVIKAYADQFLTQNFSDNNGNTLVLFQTTVDSHGNSVPLGTGLSGSGATPTFGGVVSGDNSTYNILLADNSGSVPASVQRTVQYLFPNTGMPTLVSQTQAAGYLLRGDFLITYPFQGRTMTESVTAIRAIP